jgi:hypothetical protein
MQKLVVRNLDGNILYPLGGVENNQLGMEGWEYGFDGCGVLSTNASCKWE